MPKNAVERLQKIENDLKTAITIYDAANKSNNESENPGKKKKDPDHCQHPKLDAKSRSYNLLGLGKHQTTPVGSVRRVACLIPRPVEDIQLMKFRNKKPSSAPSSGNASSTGESDFGCHPEIDFLLKTEDFVSIGSHSVDPRLFMSPSIVLETANKILSENNYVLDEIGDNKKYPNEMIVNCVTIKAEGKKHEKDRCTTGNCENKKNEAVSINTRASVNRTNFKVSESKTRSKALETKNTSEFSPGRHVIPNKIPRLEKRDKPPGVEVLPRKTFNKTRNIEIKESKERQNRAWSCEKDLRSKKANSQRKRSSSEEVKRKFQSGLNKSSTDDKTGNTKREPEKPPSESTDENFEETQQYFDVKEMTKLVIDSPSDTNLEAEQLSKIIEKSNEKLHRMKVSKNLALDIAKQLKEKYEEVQLSNKELLGMLKKVEKDNEKLKYAVKDVTDSKMQLKLKMEEMRVDSKTMLLEQGIKTREKVEENIRLRTKMKDLKEKHSQEMMDKQKEIDRIQKDIRCSTQNSELQNVFQRKMAENENENQEMDVEGKENRSQETKNEDRKPETRGKNDVRILIDEKSQLLKKVKHLESLLSAKQSKMETLEGKVRCLEKELDKQNVQLKQKTERLENANNELESIRRSSKDLEEQVKHLRLNIENFDSVHENLAKQSSNYEKEIKSCQEEMKKLKEENGKLSKELENERDSLLIKNKIIDDQHETIRQLRDRSEEHKTTLKKIQSLERILNVEREEKLELQEAIERLKQRKDDLKKKIKSLENDLLVAPQEVVRDLQKTQMVLHELENQVQIKQKEWELHLKTLIREKEQACNVAEFATKKLMQTTSEFQKQSEAHKRLRRVLTENLALKGRRRKEASDKVTTQVQKIADDTPTTQTDVKGTSKYLQYCSSVDDGTFRTRETPVWLLPRRTMTSYYVQCPRKTENFP